MSDDAARRGREIHDAIEKLRNMIDDDVIALAGPPQWTREVCEYLSGLPKAPPEPTGQTYKGIPIYADVALGQDSVFVIDRAALRSVTPFLSFEDFMSQYTVDWKPPAAGYRTFDRQMELYQRLTHQEPEWRALKRRSEDALHRAINGRTFGGRWWRDLRDSIVLGFKADWSKTVHPDRMVPKPARSLGMLTGPVVTVAAPELVGPDGENLCSCGKPVHECPELGWPHEWNPVATLDGCVLCGYTLHAADEWARYGSGYAHLTCIDPPPPKEYVDMPLLWEGWSD